MWGVSLRPGLLWFPGYTRDELFKWVGGRLIKFFFSEYELWSVVVTNEQRKAASTGEYRGMEASTFSSTHLYQCSSVWVEPLMIYFSHKSYTEQAFTQSQEIIPCPRPDCNYINTNTNGEIPEHLSGCVRILIIFLLPSKLMVFLILWVRGNWGTFSVAVSKFQN